jgi:hypothetical protein
MKHIHADYTYCFVFKGNTFKHLRVHFLTTFPLGQKFFLRSLSLSADPGIDLLTGCRIEKVDQEMDFPG